MSTTSDESAEDVEDEELRSFLRDIAAGKHGSDPGPVGRASRVREGREAE